MKLFYTCAKVLAMAAITAAAPQAVRSSEAISFPGQSQQPSVLTFEQAVGVMSPKNGGPVSTSATGNGGVSAQAGCRRNIFRKWGLLSAQEKSGFVGAIQCLMRTPPKGIWGGARSRYDELVWVHSEMTPRVHGSDMFLPWHRYYLFAFRQLLKKECGYRGPVPWWRETNNAGNFGASDIFSSQYFGALPPADGNGNGRCLSDGAFAGSRDPITGQCVARGEIRAETNFVSFANEDLCQGQQGATFSQHRACVEGTNHARLHRGIGPTMANAAVSPADPLFFLHHSYIDWQWKRWQNASPDRWQTISGCINTAGSCVPLTRKTVLTSLGLIRDSTVGKFLDTEGRLACYTYDELV